MIFFGKREKPQNGHLSNSEFFFGTTRHRRKNNFPKKKISTLNRECLPTGEENEKKFNFAVVSAAAVCGAILSCY